MNSIKKLGKTVKDSYSKNIIVVNNFIDKYRVVKTAYYLGIMLNTYFIYRSTLKIIAIKDVSNHLDEQAKRLLKPEEELKQRQVSQFLKARQLQS